MYGTDRRASGNVIPVTIQRGAPTPDTVVPGLQTDSRSPRTMLPMSVASHAAREHRLCGLFSDSDSAERAFQACLDRGYEPGQLNVVVSEGTRQRLLATRNEIKAELADRKAEGGELGGPKGGRVGILVAIFAAVGAAVAVPAIGFVAGPIAIALTAAGAAGVAAGLIGALGDWGIPPERIRKYESAVKNGDILIMVAARTGADAREIADTWAKIGGREIHNG